MRKHVKVSGIILVIVVVAMSFAGCAKAPTTELANAKTEFQKAKDDGAEQYAPEDYMSAEEALNQAEEFMKAGKYKDARAKAIEAQKLARQAQVTAANNKNATGDGAQQMITVAIQAIDSANEVYADTYAEALMLEARAKLEEAKQAYAQKDYNTAKQLAEVALNKAQEAEAVAKEKQAQGAQGVASQAAIEARDPGAMPRPLPMNHVVMKGESLWWIAEYKQIYGDPFQWPLIYKANRNLIKDPDLIFPDQNFAIPRSPEVTEDMIKDAIKFAKSRGAWSLHDGK